MPAPKLQPGMMIEIKSTATKVWRRYLISDNEDCRIDVKGRWRFSAYDLAVASQVFSPMLVEARRIRVLEKVIPVQSSTVRS